MPVELGRRERQRLLDTQRDEPQITIQILKASARRVTMVNPKSRLSQRERVLQPLWNRRELIEAQSLTLADYEAINRSLSWTYAPLGRQRPVDQELSRSELIVQ